MPRVNINLHEWSYFEGGGEEGEKERNKREERWRTRAGAEVVDASAFSSRRSVRSL